MTEYDKQFWGFIQSELNITVPPDYFYYFTDRHACVKNKFVSWLGTASQFSHSLLEEEGIVYLLLTEKATRNACVGVK